MSATSSNLVMPRRFAIQLLHEAQIAGPRGFLAAVGAHVWPDTYFIGESGVETAALLADADARFAAQSRQLWAVYLHRPERSATPVPEDFALRPQTPRLTASLETKGVLQLRAWTLDAGGRVGERVLKIED